MSAQNAARIKSSARVASDWRGLAICLAERDDSVLYCLRLIHDDPANATVILQTSDEREAVAVWRYWTSTLRLPRMVEHAPNQYDAIEWRCGELIVRSRSPRRRGSPLFGRRPRRLGLRKVAKSGAGCVHRDEREMIARN